MENQMNVFLFGDQANNFVPGLRHLLRIKDSPLLLSFLEQTHLALRQEISRQRREVQEQLPRFTRVADLLAAYSADLASAPVLGSTLTAIYQLGSVISHYGDGSRPYPAGQSNMVLGLCTGQLAACAVACASSASELVSLAIEAVVIAFRVGMHVSRIRDLMETGPDRQQSWSYIVPKLRVDLAESRITQFSQAANLPVGSRPFVGTVAPSSVTVFGHPQILKDFLNSPTMRDVKSIPVSVFGLYHEPHLNTEADIATILEGLSEDFADIPLKLPAISSVTGKQMLADTYGALLHTSLTEILRETLRLDTIIESLEISCKASSYPRWVISSVGTNIAQNLASALDGIDGTTIEVAHIARDQDTRSPHVQARSTGRPEQSKIAIIGYSGRFPEAVNSDSLWELLHQGRDVHRKIPSDRFDVNSHYDPSGKAKNTSQVQYGCFINEPGLFDSRFFNLSPKEADQSDPGQRLALMTAYEALEMAGVVPDGTPSTQRDRVGVFYGMTSDDWREVNSGQNVGTYFIPGGNRAFTPGRINYYFKFSGPSVSVDTACSSSAAAIHMACNSLWRNDCDTAIAGGTNVMTNPDNFAGLDKGHFLSRTGNCKTFDDGADGYCRADAVGTVVLKRLEDALADKDPIQAVICGAYTNHSAEAESITRPHIGAQSAIFRRILNDAGQDPLDVSYIEMHGTGTQAGDAVEMRSVLDVFTGARSGRSVEKPLFLGSVKANVGHAESGSGVTALIKVMLMMKNSEIPPHCGIKTKINSGFPKDLRERGIDIAMEATEWPRPKHGAARMAFINNFSAAGGNSAMLVEDAPAVPRPQTSEDRRKCHAVVVSARTVRSLRQNAAQLVKLLRSHPDTSLGSLAYTTTARRMHHNYRLSVTGQTVQDISKALEQSAESNSGPVPRQPPRIVFAFTGQGSIYEGMGEELFASFSVFRDELRRLHAISKSFGFDSFMPLLNNSTALKPEHPSPQASQLALVCFEIALARLWESFGVTPSVVVGHSLGEYAALHIAGVLSARDVVFLVGTRAGIMQNRCPLGTHAMLAVKARLEALTEIMQNHRLEVVCINGPNQIVLAGLGADIDRAQEALSQSGVKSTRLKTDLAFHSSQVEPVLDEFEKFARGVIFRAPTVPIISPLLATVITSQGHLDSEYLARHCRETVNMVGAVQDALSQGVISEQAISLEIGPDPVVTGMLRATIGPSTRTLASARKNDSLWTTLSETLSTFYQAGLDILWGEYHRDFDAFQSVIPLPAYQWDYKNHWINYVHDWCLTKGDAPPTIAASPEAPAAASTFLSATCQKIIHSEHGKSKSSVLIESDILHPDLRAVFEAHKVNGARLCPSSVYADIAMTLGNYLHKDNPMTANRGIEVADMASTKPLIMRSSDESAYFRVSAEADWASQTAKVAYYSVDSKGQKVLEHATCLLRFGDPDAWMVEWKPIAYLIQSRVQALQAGTRNGDFHLIKRGMAYKLFENCVEYAKSFQGIDEVSLDSAGHEATARVVFKDNSTCFHANPYYIDSLGHLSGFIMNATESFDYKTQVFLNHGWNSIRCAVNLSADNTYQTYVKMQSSNGQKYSGDVYIFQGDSIIGVNRGVSFQAVPRKVLDVLLPFSTKGAGVKAANDAKPVATARPGVSPPAIASKPGTSQLPTKRQAPAQQKQVVSSESLLIVQALNIITEETGIVTAEMKNELVWEDVGVDSLMSLAICGRLREELNIDMPSTIFTDYPTVRDFKRYFDGGSGAIEISEDSSKSSTFGSRFSSNGVTPETCSDITQMDEDEKTQYSVSGESDAVSLICTVLADEIGVAVEDVVNAPSFTELGLDSLLSLSVLGRLREEADMDLPSDFFFDTDVTAIRKKLLGDTPPPIVDSMTRSAKPVVIGSSPAAIPAATSVLLQGSLAAARKILFLFPDGSGSATSYVTLPRVAPDVAVIGLNCPYMKRPQDLKCALQDLTVPYLNEIRRRQAHGPYYLGGWSAGGICAYDAAATLMADGEQVASLILIDSPNPIGLEKLPVRVYDFLASIGFFGSEDSKPAPEWLLPHFLAFIDALDLYRPKAFAQGAAPATHAIWAADGVYTSTGGRRLQPQSDDPESMKWLLHDRTHFGPNGWDTLVGAENLRMEVLEGANHFTMMEGPKGLKLSQFLARSMGV